MTESMLASHETPIDPEQAILHQDGYRRVILGEVADPLFPPHPGAPESSEDELTRSALEDPEAQRLDLPHPSSTLWRVLTLLMLAVMALAAVFWWLR